MKTNLHVVALVVAVTLLAAVGAFASSTVNTVYEQSIHVFKRAMTAETTAQIDGALYVDGGVTFRNSTAPATLFGDLSATTASSSVPVFQVVPTATLDTNDLIFAVKSVAGGSNVASIDLEGDVVAVGGAFSGAVSGTTITGSGAVSGTTITGSAAVQGTSMHATATTGVGTCTLNGGSPSTCTATTVSGYKCVCVNTGTATNSVKCLVASTTLTVTGPNAATDLVTYICM